MPIAPAVKGILIASSLVAAAVAAYENNPQVRDFVDTTKLKAQYALEDFLENLEAELNPDPNARLRMRQRRRERTAQAMDAGSNRNRNADDLRRSGGKDVTIARGTTVVASGHDGASSSKELRHRHPASRASDDQISMHTTETHSTFFDASNSTDGPTNVDSATKDLEGLSISDDVSSHTPSVDDLLDLDPFVDPLDPYYPHNEPSTSRTSTPLVLSIPLPEDVAQDGNEMRMTPTTPMSFATMSSPILTPVTPRTPRRGSQDEEDLSDSYFSELGDEGQAGHARQAGGATISTSGRGEVDEEVMSVHSEASSVGFETPDEDEDEDWGRA